MSFEIAQLQKRVTELESQLLEALACIKVQADNVTSLLACVNKLQDGQDLLLRAIEGLEATNRIGR